MKIYIQILKNYLIKQDPGGLLKKTMAQVLYGLML